MTLLQVVAFASLAAGARLSGLLERPAVRTWILCLSSSLVLFLLQPVTGVRQLDYWLPLGTLLMCAAVWAITRPAAQPLARADIATATAVAALCLALAFTRYLAPELRFSLGRAPPPETVVLVLALFAGLLVLAQRRQASALPALLAVQAVFALFIFLKVDVLTAFASSTLRGLAGQDTTLASGNDIRWLGFSYIAFRLLHALFEFRNGKMPALTLREFVTWVVFFPALVAGPIDRAARFAQDLRSALAPRATDMSAGLGRIASGLAKKFVLADSLALFSLNEINAAQATSAGWLWVLLYAYALRLYLDFSGYTDLAIGLGNLLGVRLPENFNAPYSRPNLTQFWNSWHMSLAQWFRAHFFNPATRALRASPRHLPPALIILFTQLLTMTLIGAWHGLSAGFLIWGLWHGTGLFVHNRWAEWMRPRMAALAPTPLTARVLHVSGALLTFHFVALGWVWFAIASPQLSWWVLLRLLAHA